MKKIVLAVMGTVSGLVMLFSYHTSTTGGATVAPAGTDAGNPDATSGTTTTSPGVTPTGSASTATSAGGDGTYTGEAVQTRYGAVQVQITVQDGRITASEAIQYPNQDHHDQQINAYAVPILNAEVVAAQSAAIDAVSGATVTSEGYLESLQSAIDAAHLA
ncbi:MAG: FMN-binding protein [Propionibacteriaceae bacterium]|nr:FMN-binding protein [Propionibacteriaceae bacterium]